jgi:hypothetical protein
MLERLPSPNLRGNRVVLGLLSGLSAGALALSGCGSDDPGRIEEAITMTRADYNDSPTARFNYDYTHNGHSAGADSIEIRDSGGFVGYSPEGCLNGSVYDVKPMATGRGNYMPSTPATARFDEASDTLIVHSPGSPTAEDLVFTGASYRQTDTNLQPANIYTYQIITGASDCPPVTQPSPSATPTSTG